MGKTKILLVHRFFFDNPEFEGVSLDATEIPQNSSEIEYTFGGTFRVDYQLIRDSKEQFKLSLNVLDQRYYNTTNDSVIGFGASPQEPFTLTAGIGVGFGN